MKKKREPPSGDSGYHIVEAPDHSWRYSKETLLPFGAVFPPESSFRFVSETEDEVIPFLFGLGMSRDRKLIEVGVPGTSHGARLKDYRALLFGVVVEISKRRRFPHPSYRLPGTYYSLKEQDGRLSNGPYVLIHVWRQRIYMKDCEAYLEKVWAPARKDWSVALLNLDHIPRMMRVRKATSLLRGIALGEKIDREMSIQIGGRPQGGRELSKSEFRLLAREAATKVGSKNEPLTRGRLASELRIARTTVTAYLSREPGLFEKLKSMTVKARAEAIKKQ